MSYGKTFSVIGRGADEQNGGTIDSVDAVIYDENSVEIARKTFTGISTSIDFSIADWNEEGDNFYKKIYGTDENAGTKNYYLELIAYDDARQVPPKEGDRGNSTNILYLSNDLSVIDGYKPNTAYQIKNGSLSRSATTDTESYKKLEEALNKAENQITRLSFSLNPVNNPYFEVQGYEALGKEPNLENETYGFMNKNKLTVNIYVGRDKKQIKPETVSVWLEPCDLSGKIIPNSTKIVLLEKGAINSSGAKTEKAIYTEDFKTSATSCTWISNSLDAQSVKNLEIGKYYRICVDAEDYGNVKIRNQNDYGIKFTTVNSAPIIVITEPQGGTKNIAMSAAYDVKGTVKTSSKISKISFYKNEYKENAPAENLIKEIAVNPNEQIIESEISSLENKIVKNSDKSNSSQAYYNFAYTIEKDKITDNSYTLFAVAFDDTNQHTQKEIYIENDKSLPEFDEPTITPVVSVETEGKFVDYVNGTVTISQLISDDKKVEKSWWSDAEVMPNKNSNEGWKEGIAGSSATNLKFTVNTANFEDKKDKKIWLKSEDSSGNIKTSEITLHINQSTDAPVVKLSNTECNEKEIQYSETWKETDYTTAKRHNKRTVFGTTNNNTILGNISDDDGIAEVKVYYQSIKLNDSNNVEVGEKQEISLTNEPDGKTTYTLNAKMPSEQGTYLITVEVTDSKQEETGYNSKTVGPFLVAVDDGAPKLKIETAGGFQKKEFKVKGTVDDKNAVLYRCENKDDETGIQITVNPDGTWEDTVTVTGSEAKDVTVYYKAKDDYDQTAVEPFKYKYDPEPPTFEITKVQGDDWGKFNKDELYGTTDTTTYFMISGTVSDIKKSENGASGFKNSNFYYYFGQTEPAKENNIYKLDENWKTCKIESANADGTEGKFTASINFNELGAKDGERYNIYFAVKDDAGNVSAINEAFKLSVTIDSTPPEITAAKLGEKISAAPKLILNVTEKVALDIESLKVLNNGAEFAKENYTVEKSEQPETQGNYTITVTIKEGKVPVGENKFTFSIKDKAKNESKSENSIIINNKAPVIGVPETGIPKEAYKVEKQGIQYSYIKEKITATATVTCEGNGNKLENVKWKDSGTDEFVEKVGVCTPGADGKITVTMPENIDDYENKYITRTVTATNIYGQSNIWTYYFILDKTAPVLKTESSGDDITSLGGTNVNSLGTKWFNKDTLELKGVYEENGSGVKQIDYKLSIGNGEPQTGTVYTSGNNNGKENFASIISGFAESPAQNTITLTATDNAGNTSSSTPYYVNIDKTAPVLKENVAPAAAEDSETSTIWYRFTGESTWNKYDNSILTNKAKNIELTGYFEDKSEFGDNYRQSGVSKITVNVNNKNVDAKVYKKTDETDGTENWSVPQDGTGFEVSEDNSSGYWFATIPDDYLGNDGTYSAKVTITDNANNSNSTPLSFLVDTKAPTVTVEMPSANSTLNGNNTFSGKVNDNNDVKSIGLYYFIGDDFSTPKTLGDFVLLQGCTKDTANDANLSEITSWKFTNINVNELLGGSVSGTMRLLPVAYDKAGNCNINTDAITTQNCTEITIDLNSDRPIIKFNNLSKSGDDAYLNAGTLNISLEDDDGIAEVKYYFGDVKPDSWENENVKTATLNSGSVSIDLGDDGKKSLWFKITDTEGGTFETANSSAHKQPYVKFGSVQKNNDTAIIFTKDTTSPALSALKFCYGTDKNSLSEAQDFASEDAVVVGGTERKYVVFKTTAVDNGSGIKAVTLKVSGVDDSYKLTSTEENPAEYQTAAIDVSTWSEGSHTLTFTATDKAGLSVTETKQITVDNNGPEINIITPEQNDTQTGIVTFSGTANDSYSSVAYIRYLVLNNEYYNDDGSPISEIEAKVKEAILKDDYSCSNTGTNNTWKFKLDGVLDGENKRNALLPANAEELKEYSKVPHGTEGAEKDIYTMTVYLYAKDSLGNEKLKSQTFKYNPYGDRPTAEVTFPTGTETEKANVNGSIRITGSAIDNVSVSKVYVQIDVNNDGIFDDTDKDLLAEMKDAEQGIYTIITNTDLDPNADTSALGNESFWGIAANGTNSWNLTINQYGEMLREDNKISGENSKYGIKIRAVAVDDNKKFGNWSVVQHVIIDNNIPSIGKRNKNLLEYKAGNDNDYAVRPYTPDMYSKGKTALELSVEDVNGIKQVMYYIAATEEKLSSATGNKVDLDKAKKLTEGGTTGYIVKIPLTEGSSESGTKYVKVVATKNSDSETTAYEKFSINFDNSAPTINNITLNGVAYEHSDKKIVNSNGTYFTLGGSVQDDGGSGFDKVLFYYYREKSGGGNERIYDPMIDSTKVEDAGRINLSDSQIKTRTLGEQTLYGTEQEITIDSDKKSFEITNTNNKHIRAGGVVEIAGTWFTIHSIEGTKVTLKSDAPVTGEQTTAFFAYAQVIDNTGSEKNDENGGITGDDGDGMAESIIKSLNTWSYDATFRSNYIPDGPGKLFVFAFDKAGNVSAADFEASVQNNAPRLTRVMLATDLNGDGKYQYYSETETGPVNNMSDNATPNGTEFGEFAFYSTLNNKGEASNVAAVTLPNGREPFIVKNKLLAVPEFVGGNGDLSYTYKIVDSLTDATVTEGSPNAFATVTVITDDGETNKFETGIKIESKGTNPFENSKTVLKDSQGNEITVQSKMFELDNSVLEDYESWVGDSKNIKYLAATFWDSTEETTAGKDSCYALLKMPLIINVNDDVLPTADIIPFYWNSKEDSSFVYDENGNPLGHIDIPETDSENPGVSGVVYVEGTAYDDTKLSEILIKKPGENDFKSMASFADRKWTYTTYENGNTDFEILEDLGITQKGHTVKWRLKIDMSVYGIATGQKIKVQAKDAATKANVSADSEVQTTKTAPTPTYKMDFVPYIKSIYATNIGSANRSRLGKFPVRAGKEMTIEGMNFVEGASYTVNFYKTVNGKPASTPAEHSSGTIGTAGQITVAAPQHSRWVEVVVEGVATKNNTNKNDGYNIEAGYVAQDKDDFGKAKANKAGTNFWTDDRYVSVWNVGTTLPGSINPHSGVMKKVRAEDTVNGNVGIKGSSSLIENKTNMNDNYLTFISSDDMRVYVYDDINKNFALGSDNVATFTSPVDAVDMVVLGGLPYYILQTNYVGNSAANSWGPGLILSREGFVYSKGTYETTETLSEETYNWIIERQGNNSPAATRNSSEGYDSILYQFKNPRIAGWHTDSPGDDATTYSNNGGAANGGKRTQLDYVYVSYYDSYAKCLKFAAFRSGRDMDGQRITNIAHSDWGGGNSGDKELVAEVRSADGNMKSGATVVAGYDTTTNNPTSFKEKAGEWSDIVVDATSGSPIPVIVYYNETKKCIEVAQGNSKFPKSSNYNKTDIEKDENRSGADVWHKSEIRLDNSKADFGRYVSCAIDNDGNLHVAAQNATNASLYYLYLKKNGISYTKEKEVLLDSASGSGVWTDIELKNPNGKTLAEILPTVSYMNSSYVGTTEGIKVAYISNGTENNIEFDVMTDPAIWSAGNQRTSVMAHVKETKDGGNYAPVAVGFNSDMYVVDFLRGEE